MPLPYLHLLSFSLPISESSIRRRIDRSPQLIQVLIAEPNERSPLSDLPYWTFAGLGSPTLAIGRDGHCTCNLHGLVRKDPTGLSGLFLPSRRSIGRCSSQMPLFKWSNAIWSVDSRELSRQSLDWLSVPENLTDRLAGDDYGSRRNPTLGRFHSAEPKSQDKLGFADVIRDQNRQSQDAMNWTTW